MATTNDYYGKSYEEVQQLPWQNRIDYYANNPTLYNQEMSRIDSVLAGNPNHTAGYKWKDQLRAARDNVVGQYGKYDLSQPRESVLTTIKPKYENQIADLLSQIQNAMNQQAGPIDVTSDPRYQAQQALMERNVKNNQRQTMEQMNSRGLLMSDMTNDRLGQIEQDAMVGLNAMVPALYEAISNERYRDNQSQMSNLMSLLGVYQQEDQRHFGNEMAMQQMTLQERQVAFNEGLQMRNYNQAIDAWIIDTDLANRQFALNEQNSIITNAMNKVNTIGFVMDEATAKLLGVPVGTKSSAAFEAAENRKLQYQMHRQSLSAQERAQKSSNINQLIALWQTSGVAPSGLEQFGIKAGQALHQTPAQQLQDILAAGEIANQQQQQAMQEALPSIKSTFGVNDITAQAIYKVWENPTKDSALADYKSNLKAMKEGGIDTKYVLDAINYKFDTSIGQPAGVPYSQYGTKKKQQEIENLPPTIFTPGGINSLINGQLKPTRTY